MLDFAGKRWWYLSTGIILVVTSLVILAIPPFLRPGIEFTSGSSFTIEFEAVTLADGTVKQPDVNQEKVVNVMKDLGYDEVRVQNAGGGNAYLIRTKVLEGAPPIGEAAGPLAPGEIDVIQTGLCNAFGVVGADGSCQGVLRRDFSTVSGTVSTEIARNSAFAVGAASIAILIYMAAAFRKLPNSRRYGACAVIAAMHDALIVLASISLMGKLFGTEVDTAFITAILTVIGFSVHDKIVVFDRIREKLVHDPSIPFTEAVNASLTETLARSLSTSIVVVLTVSSMLLIGGPTIRTFLLVLLIGIIAGTYSSIAIASQALIAWHNHDISRFWKKLRGGDTTSPAAAPVRNS